MEGGSRLEFDGIEYVDHVESEAQIKREMSRMQSRRKKKDQKKATFEGGEGEQNSQRAPSRSQMGSRSRFGSAAANRIPKKETDSQRRARIKKSKYKTIHDYSYSNSLGSTFWMKIDDFCKYFYIMSIGFTNKDFIQSFCQDQVFSFKWGCFELDMPTTEKDCYFSMF